MSVLAKKIAENSYLIIPTALLMIICLTTIVFAILTTKPKITHGIFTREQVTNKEANLLFFGNFHNMSIGDYEAGIREIMYDKDYLYKSMTRDIFFLGKVLAVKYKLLRMGYNTFMYGLIASVLAFSVCIMLTSH